MTERSNADAPKVPSVDIITATNRSGEFLSQTVASIIAQTHEGWHHYIIDTGSPDRAALSHAIDSALVGRTAPDAIRDRITVASSERPGVSAGRNAGVALGHGDYVAFLDDDDAWHPEFLQRMATALANTKGAVAAYCAGRYMDDEGELRPDHWPARPASSATMLRGDYPFPYPCALLIDRQAGEQAGWFDERFAYSEDMDLVCRLLMIGEFVAVPQELAYYRIQVHSVSHKPHAVRLSWAATEMFLREKIDAAQRDGDTTLARQLRRNLRCTRSTRAEAASHEVLITLRTGRNLGEAGRIVRFALAHAPLRFLWSGFRRLTLAPARTLARKALPRRTVGLRR